MRQKSLQLVIAFHTTTGAMAMESACMEAGLPGRLIPVPREITANCGLAWRAPVDARAALLDFTRQRELATAGWYEMMI